MLVQKALRELDGEIDRLSKIRAIVASLHSTQSPIGIHSTESSGEDYISGTQNEDGASVAEQSAGTSESTDAALPKRSYRKLRFERSARTRRPTPPVPRALGGTIPAKPVFIASGRQSGVMSAAPALPKDREILVERPGEGLDALLRELSSRPNAQRM